MDILEDKIEITLGPARLLLTPCLPWVWQEAALESPGPASLCLALLPLADVSWRGVARRGRETPSPADTANLADLPAAALEPLLEALCPPWLNQAQAEDLKALRRYLQTQADFPGLDCADCRDQEARGEGRPDCAACPRPTAPAQALPALALYPLLSALPDAGAWAASWLRGLSPGRARLLAMRLATIARQAESRRAEADLPPTPWA